MTTCKNCGNSFDGKYCPKCSQKADTHRLTFRHLAHEVFHAVTHTDKGILLLLKELFVRPGTVAKEYNEGKRKKYFNPFTALLILLAIQVFALKQTHFFTHYGEVMASIVTEARQGERATGLVTEDKMKQQIAVAESNTKIMNSVMIPFMALLSWIFFYRPDKNFVENIVLNIFISIQVIVMFLLMCILPFLINHTFGIIMLAVHFVVRIIYYIIAYKQFFGEGTGKTLLKGISIQIVLMLVMQGIAIVAFKYY